MLYLCYLNTNYILKIDTHCNYKFENFDTIGIEIFVFYLSLVSILNIAERRKRDRPFVSLPCTIWTLVVSDSQIFICISICIFICISILYLSSSLYSSHFVLLFVLISLDESGDTETDVRTTAHAWEGHRHQQHHHGSTTSTITYSRLGCSACPACPACPCRGPQDNSIPKSCKQGPIRGHQHQHRHLVEP
jgi:hypothetical protein